MSDSQPQNIIETLRPGRFTAMNGVTVEFTEADLAAMADGYDPSLSRAPIVAGHPKHNDPAYGWIDGMRWDPKRQRLDSIPGDVDPAFAEQVRAKRYRHVSLSVYLPDSPANPKPGIYYPRHLGFLGAQPPAVKGLAEASLGEGEEGVIELAAPVDLGGWEDTTIAGLFRRLREWLIGSAGQEKADQVLPAYEIESLQEAAIRERMKPEPVEAAPNPMFAEAANAPASTVTPEPTMSQTTEKTADFAEREAELTRQQQDLQTRQAQIAAREAELARRECLDFAESLIQAGRLLPRDKEGLVEFMAALPKDATLEFGEGDARQKTTGAEWFKTFLQGLPKQVEFGEVARGAGEDGAAKPADKTVADRARAYHTRMAEKGVHLSFAEAVDAVHQDLDR
jgi:hypothetical protein